jgi:hypothetical protein
MNYQEWRTYGYISRLWMLRCGGPSGSTVSTEQGLTSQLQNAATTSLNNSNQQYQQYQQNIAPLVSQETALASGNRQSALAAAMPTISQIAGG